MNRHVLVMISTQRKTFTESTKYVGRIEWCIAFMHIEHTHTFIPLLTILFIVRKVILNIFDSALSTCNSLLHTILCFLIVFE